MVCEDDARDEVEVYGVSRKLNERDKEHRAKGHSHGNESRKNISVPP